MTSRCCASFSCILHCICRYHAPCCVHLHVPHAFCAIRPGMHTPRTPNSGSSTELHAAAHVRHSTARHSTGALLLRPALHKACGDDGDASLKWPGFWTVVQLPGRWQVVGRWTLCLKRAHTSDWNLVSHCNGVICRVWLCGTTCSWNSRVQAPLGVRRDIDHMQRLSK